MMRRGWIIDCSMATSTLKSALMCIKIQDQKSHFSDVSSQFYISSTFTPVSVSYKTSNISESIFLYRSILIIANRK